MIPELLRFEHLTVNVFDFIVQALDLLVIFGNVITVSESCVEP